MIEIIKHALGLCGEGHPNIFTAIFGSTALGGYIYYILLKFKLIKHGKRNNCSNC